MSPVYIITGAASGIGRATAQLLLDAGARVTVCDVNPDIETLFADGLGAERVLALTGDLADPAVNQQLVAATVARFGELHGIVVNAATGGPSARIEDLNLMDLQRTFDVNLTGPVSLIQAAIPALRKTCGSIVNLGSVFADAPPVGGGAYSLTKGAVHSLTRVLAVELGPDSIRCNTVAPGFILTRMHEEEVEVQAQARSITTEERFAQLRSEVPLGRHGTSEDVARAIAWLLSPESDYVTGQVVSVNGGIRFGS